MVALCACVCVTASIPIVLISNFSNNHDVILWLNEWSAAKCYADVLVTATLRPSLRNVMG
eukprot:m.378838 g.378838  ORF g.378838 m.378838 type:complete len:60 (-) comp95792_c0_seq1:43-222(-)